MVRHVLLGLAVAALVGTAFVPTDASARERTAAGAAGARTAAGTRAGTRAAVASGVGYRGNNYGGAYRPGWGAAATVGAAAAGAAAIGAGYYYNNNYNYNTNYNNSNCYRDAYGQIMCPGGYQYGY